MFGKSKLVRLFSWACLAAAWMPLSNGLLSPSQAKAEVIIRRGPIVSRPIVRVEPVAPVVPVAPIVRTEPIIRVEPVCHPWYRFGWVR